MKPTDESHLKSSYRQLPVFGRLACPVGVEATKHVLPGPESLSCPVAVCTALGTTWEASKLGGLNIKKSLQPRNDFRGKVVSRLEAGSNPLRPRGRPMTTRLADRKGEEGNPPLSRSARPSSIPTQRKRGVTDRRNLRSMAIALDPTRNFHQAHASLWLTADR
jgi:hypothetical protein